MTGGAEYESEAYHVDRDELAEMVAAACGRLAEKWWHDRESYLYALEHDPGWKEPMFWLRESRPPVRSCGEALAHILTEYEPGESVDVWEVLEWANRAYDMFAHDDRRFAHGYHRASSAIRDETGIGYPEPDPILGELA